MSEEKSFSKKIKQIILVFIATVFIIGLCACNKVPQESSLAQSSQPQVPVFLDDPTDPDEIEDYEKIEYIDQEIDFIELKEKNDDIIAWIRIPETVIDYPIVRGIDNVYYLKHNEYKEDYFAGALFTDMSNSESFRDPVTLVYGHYVPDESLFSQLHKYRDEEFFNANKSVTIFLPYNKLEYEIVAGFDTGLENILYEKDYTDEKQMEEFISWITAKKDEGGNVDVDALDKDGKYAIFSTCQSAYDNTSRYIVIAKLVKTYNVRIVIPAE